MKINQFRKLVTAAFMALTICLAVPASGEQNAARDFFDNGKKLESAGKLKEAIGDYTMAVEKDPSNAGYLTTLGYAQVSDRRFEDAVSSFNKAIAMVSDMVEARVGRGLALSGMGRYEKAIPDFEFAITKTPDNPVLYNNIGQNYYLLKKYRDAEAYLLKAIAIDPKFQTAYVNLGNIYTQLGRLDEAIAMHRKAIELEPKYALSHNNLAFVYYKKGDNESAIAEMKKAMDLEPGNDQFKKNYNFIVTQAEKTSSEKQAKATNDGKLAKYPKEIVRKPKAPEPVEPVVEKKPEQKAAAPKPEEKKEVKKEEPKVVAQKPAPSVTKEQRPAPAAKASPIPPALPAPAAKTAPLDKPKPEPQKQVATHPTPAPPLPVVTEVKPTTVASEKPSKKQESTSRKKKAAEKAARKKKDIAYENRNPSAQEVNAKTAREAWMMARYQASKGEVGKALENIDTAVALEPDNANYLTLQAILFEESGMTSRASTILSKALSIYPKHSVALNALGVIEEKAGRYDSAEGYFRKAAEADSNDGCAQANLGGILARTGRCANAYEAFGNAVENNCGTAALLNNVALCTYRERDVESALRIQKRALEMDPRNNVIVENYSFLKDKAGAKSMTQPDDDQPKEMPLYKKLIRKIPLFRKEPVAEINIITHPYAEEHQPSVSELENVSLFRLAPTVPLNIVENFVANWKPVTVLTVPPPRMRDMGGWRPNPIDELMGALAEKLESNGLFLVNRTQNAALNLGNVQDRGTLMRALGAQPADIVVAIGYGKADFTDVEALKYYGLKKNPGVRGVYTAPVTIIDARTKKTLFSGNFTGENEVYGTNTLEMTATERDKIRRKAVDDYFENIDAALREHFNLTRHPAGDNIVRVIPVRWSENE